MTVRLRFVDTESSLVSRIIRSAEMGALWSHVECVTPDGKYLGSVMNGNPDGVAARDPTYDTTWTRELFVDVPATAEQEAAFWKAAYSRIGTPYDLEALGIMADGVLTGSAPDLGSTNSLICSAFQTQNLLAAGIVKTAPFSVRLATPRDVLAMCAALIDIPLLQINIAPAKLIFKVGHAG